MMARALELAEQGKGLVSPGPLVGCVVVDQNGAVAGEGFYVFERIHHAETLALAQAGERARGGTAYVSLEPHAHHGRTPPCTDALIAAGIRRVVAPIQDLNPKVAGRGFEHLQAAGIELQTGLLAAEAAKVNEKYLHFMRTGLPFVHLKLAVSLDGKIATRTGDSRWIAGPEARIRAHELRHENDAILVGGRTVQLDDPALTDRSGMSRRRPLVRVVLDDRLNVRPDSQLAVSINEAPVLVFAGSKDGAVKLRELGIEVVDVDPHEPLEVLQTLASRSLQSVLVEGGGRVAGSFLDAGLVNKVTFFVAPKIIGGADAPTAIAGHGVDRMAEAFVLHYIEQIQHGVDIEITGYPQRPEERKDEGF
jgi:diaminohydroxyphosphoribosylaminopyrimidine deaminase/5-amino-6-(5-phosphoribosylamino)uracil reductase